MAFVALVAEATAPLTIDPKIEVSQVGFEYEPVEYKPFVTVAALPEMLIPHVPVALVPETEGAPIVL